MTVISEQLTDMQNTTAQYQATQTKTTGTTELGADAFLTLMLKELQYQDPMDPVSNKEFISQQAQLTQVTETQKLNSNITSNNAIMQTLALVGKEVTMTNPDDSTKTIVGKVTQAGFTGDSSTITVDGKDYPTSYIQTVRDASTTTK